MGRVAPICPTLADNLGHELFYFRLPWQTNKTLIITIPSLLSTYFSSAFPNISNSFIASISFASSSLPFAEYGL